MEMPEKINGEGKAENESCKKNGLQGMARELRKAPGSKEYRQGCRRSGPVRR